MKFVGLKTYLLSALVVSGAFVALLLDKIDTPTLLTLLAIAGVGATLRHGLTTETRKDSR